MDGRVKQELWRGGVGGLSASDSAATSFQAQDLSRPRGDNCGLSPIIILLLLLNQANRVIGLRGKNRSHSIFVKLITGQSITGDNNRGQTTIWLRLILA